MTRTLTELEAVATACMESSDPNVEAYHRGAGGCARAAEAAEHDGRRRYYRGREAEQLLAALEQHEASGGIDKGGELTTAERLLAAAMIAARANGNPLELGRRAARDYATDRLREAAGDSLTAWEDEEHSVRDEHQEMIEELEASIFYFDAHGPKMEDELADPEPPIRVLVALEGGIIQGTVADRPGVEIVQLDYDTEGADAEDLFAIPQSNGSTAEAWRSEHTPTVDAAFIDGARAARPSDPVARLAMLRREAASADARDDQSGWAREIRRELEELEAELATA